MNTVLVVAYHFPPEESSCSEKNIRIVKLLLDNGYKVVVLTKPGLNSNLSQFSNLIIIRTKSLGVFHKKNNDSICLNSHSKSTNSFISKIRNFISKKMIPDGTIDWYLPARKCININNKILCDVDLILSISSPYSAHIVSHYISTKINVPYIMSYGDPWLYEPKRKKSRLRYLIEKKIEGSILNDASKILLITEWNKRKYEEIYKLSADKIVNYHIGYDSENILDIPYKKKSIYRILYGGSLDPVHRNPEPLLLAMKNVNNVEVHIYCNDNPQIYNLINEYNIGNKVFLHPLIRSSDFNKLMYDFDALLLFGNKTPFQVPGKVFTYIGAGKAILYIKNNNYDDDGTEEILSKYGNTIVVKNEPKDIENCLLKCKTKLDNIQVSNPLDFEYHETMKPIITVIESILQK